MSEANRYADTFRQEAEELLTVIEESVLDMEQDPQDADAVNRLFRAMHTIKGSGGMFGFDDIANFTHHVETVLDQVRAGSVPVTQTLIDLILASRDQIKAMLEADPGAPVDIERNAQIIAGLQQLTAGGEAEDMAGSAVVDAETTDQQGKQLYRIRFRPHRDILASGMDPHVLLLELRDLGPCQVTAVTDEIPKLEDMNPQHCYLSWDVLLETDKGRSAIQDVFIFVEGDSEVRIDEIEADESEEISKRVGEILVERGDVTPDAVEEVARKQQRLGEMLVQEGAVSADRVRSALNEQETLKRQKAVAREGSVRVPSDKLDNLINLVGELVITQAQLTQIAARIEDMDLARPVEEVERLTAELRDSVLNIRMMPIGTTFNKFRRLVRDLSKDLNKEIDLVTEGAETELDKTVIERLGDPLVHIIRNSVDHGIETPEQRVAAGKCTRGTIRLAAVHKGTNVVISIEDDGKGLDRETIRTKAIEKGLIAADAELSDKEIFAQILQPGFSTAAQVTNVSGRGVGMDVVKREIDALGGSIEINSETGRGSTMSLSLPLTLAIIDGLLVDVGGDRFVVPVSVVEECLELHQGQHALDQDRNIIQVRGELVSYVRLREIFAIDGARSSLEEMVIVRVDDMRIGIVVDHIIGDHQTVIKSLGKVYQDVEGVSGATIMGDGNVALILDLAQIVACAQREEHDLIGV